MKSSRRKRTSQSMDGLVGNSKNLSDLVQGHDKISGFAEILWSCKSWRQFRTKEIEKRKKWRVDVLSADIRFDDRNGLIPWIFRKAYLGHRGHRELIEAIHSEKLQWKGKMQTRSFWTNIESGKCCKITWWTECDLLIFRGFWHGQKVTCGY